MPVHKLNQSIRDEVYRQVREVVLTEHETMIGQCLECAWYGYQVLKSWPGAPRTIIQAGSTQWPRIKPEDDDGVCSTHFSCMWNPNDPVTKLYLAGLEPIVSFNGELQFSMPEIHVWLACPSTEEVIDFTTGTWPQLCQATLGLDWPGVKPPEYLWDFGSTLPPGVKYIADRAAIELVITILKSQNRNYP